MISKYCFILPLLGAVLPLTTQAQKNCPLLGPDFPPPKNLSTSSAIQSAKLNLSQALSEALFSGNTSFGLLDSVNTSYALEIFSTHDSNLVFSNYSDGEYLKFTQDGVKTVDTNTVFRIGSLSKLLTVYTFLIHAGDIHFNDPVTTYVPELLEASQKLNATENPLDYVAWDEITLGNLASHAAGIGRDNSGFLDLSNTLLPVQDSQIAGLPPLNSTEIPICPGGGFCTRAQFFEGFTEHHPVYAPSTAAIYSNAGFQILAYAVENITGIDFPTLVKTGLFDPLSLSGSSWVMPKDNTSGIIPPGAVWGLDLGDTTAAGGAYSSPSNMTAMGRSILSSSLIMPSLTRRWMKPHSHTSDPFNFVGSPWEITRLQLPSSSRLVDMYTKEGDIPGYSSFLILIPDWDLGITIMTAGESSITNIRILANIVAESFLPAVEDSAKEEAENMFSGTYISSTPGLNSSIILSTDASKPGLGVETWISNSTDLLTSPTFGPSVRLYPTGLKRVGENGDILLGFRAVYEDLSQPASVNGLFGEQCISWQSVDMTYWGGVASDDILITVGVDGKAKSVTPRILRDELVRSH